MQAMSNCPQCGAEVEVGNRFCGQCGQPLGDGESLPQVDAADTMYAQLVRIHGGGVDGERFRVDSKRKTIGRVDADICFSDDSFISPLHASVQFEAGKLVIRDENSRNGVYKRLRGSAMLRYGESFMAGEQLLRVEDRGPDGYSYDAEGTQFFGSAPRAHPYCVRQMLEGGQDGMLVRPARKVLVIGREHCDLEFPHDRFISGKHCKLEFEVGGVQLTDLDSRNGTYLKVPGATELCAGDFVFVGRQLLRVELKAQS